MPFINRLSTLFNADVHAILDRVEDPISLLKQAVRTMEEESDQAELALQRLIEECERNRRRYADFETRLQKIDAELDICFESNADELAKGLVRRKLELTNHLTQLSEKRVELDAEIDKRQTRLAENHRHLERMREKLELLSDEQPGAEPLGNTSISGSVTDQDVEVAFLHEKQRRAGQ